MLQAVLQSIIVEPVKQPKKTVGGIILPGEEKYPNTGVVVSIGDITCGVKVGDTVVFKKFVGTEIKHEGKTYLHLEEKDVFGILE